MIRQGQAKSRVPGSTTIEWAGEVLELLPERAMWWRRERTLFIADPHFGKASAFRAAGIPVPELPHEADLARLDQLLAGTAAARLVILGDFFHAKSGCTPATFSALAAWRRRRPALHITLIPGNHDRRAGRPPDDWRFECAGDSWPLPPFQCRHEPCEIAGSYVLAGHLHPGFRLHDGTGELSGACFHFGRRVAVLPAFSSLAGTSMVTTQSDDRIFLIGDGEVINVSAALRGGAVSRSSLRGNGSSIVDPTSLRRKAGHRATPAKTPAVPQPPAP